MSLHEAKEISAERRSGPAGASTAAAALIPDGGGSLPADLEELTSLLNAHQDHASS